MSKRLQIHSTEKKDEALSAILLTPGEVAVRLKIGVSDPTRWLKRLCAQLDIPFVKARGRIRMTEPQFQILLDKITCSPHESAERRKTITSVARSGSAKRQSSSQNSVRELVTKALHRT